MHISGASAPARMLAHQIDHLRELLIAPSAIVCIGAHAAPPPTLHHVHDVQAHTFKKLGLWMGILASSFSW